MLPSRFLAFAAHYEFRPLAIRGNPNARPNVERSFWTFEKSFLPAREFKDLADFNQQLHHWLTTVVDQRVRHRQTPLQRFAEEKPHLLPLPAHAATSMPGAPPAPQVHEGVQ